MANLQLRALPAAFTVAVLSVAALGPATSKAPATTPVRCPGTEIRSVGLWSLTDLSTVGLSCARAEKALRTVEIRPKRGSRLNSGEVLLMAGWKCRFASKYNSAYRCSKGAARVAFSLVASGCAWPPAPTPRRSARAGGEAMTASGEVNCSPAPDMSWGKGWGE